VGSSHSCAISEAGGAMCWGSNQSGVVGNGNLIVKQPSPVDVVGLATGVTAISASQQTTCAISAGVAKCWGYNGWLQVPDVERFSYSSTPRDFALGATASLVVTGTSATCAITTAGGLKCWGEQLAASTNSATPVDIAGFGTGGVAEVAIGYGHGCFRTTSGGVKCWGKGDVGELGNSNKFHSETPVDVTGISSGALAVSTSYRYTCALVTGGVVKCWGESDYGQLGPSVVVGQQSSSPVTVPLPAAATGISAGESHACAVLTGGGVYCWGSNSQFQLGTGASSSSTPAAVVGLPSAVATIGAGGDHTCALLTNGSVKCWGMNGVGQLGTGSTTPLSSGSPVSVIAFP
jgi:alpha-tubulin suppressor-like RCC1 family protein